MIRKTGIALAAVGLLMFTAVAPVTAQARDWDHHGWGHEWRGRHDSGAAVALGVFGGLLAGAAIASTQPYYTAPAYYYSPYYAAPAYGYAGYGYYR
jgi:hypothetical protein